MREQGETEGGVPVLEGVLEGVLALEGCERRGFYQGVPALEGVPARVVAEGSSAERGSSQGFQREFHRW